MRTESFDFPFPVADTESGPVIQWKAHSLLLEFTDYLGNLCRVEFSEVPHFEFLSEDELNAGLYRYDGVVEVLDSPVISRLIEIGEIAAAESGRFHHLVIGFNEIGSYLVVICRSIAKMQPE
jgi:hypothetical protein